MRLTLHHEIVFDKEHPLGICGECGTPLMERKGDANNARQCVFELYCSNCHRGCAGTPVEEDISRLQESLAFNGHLAPGDLEMPETLKKLLART